MNERAGRWIRVSTGGQDERSQVPDIDRHISQRGYASGPDYTLHDVSASKGEQDSYVERVLADARAGRLDVLVGWHVDRFDRRGVWATGDMIRQLNAAGVRVETTDNGGQVISDRDLNGLVRMWSAREETEHKRERIRIAFGTIDAAGAWRNKAPWGFTTAGSKHGKRLVPTAEAREYIPQVYARVIGGQSLATIARWLEAEGIAPAGITGERADGRGKSGQWWPKSVGQLIRNPAYKGYATVSAATGQEHVWTSQDEPALVDAHTWQLACDALTAAQTRKRGPSHDRAGNRCALSGAVRCARCGGPMYRLKSGHGNPYLYLRCFGTGPDRKSCGTPMVRLDIAEALADEVLGNLAAPVWEITVIPGNGPELDAQLAGLNHQRRMIAMRGLSWEDEDAERARIRAEYERVSAIPRTAGERRMTDTGITYGQRWTDKLDAAGRAGWLRSGEVTVALAKGDVPDATATRDGVSLVLVWNEDADETAA